MFGFGAFRLIVFCLRWLFGTGTWLLFYPPWIRRRLGRSCKPDSGHRNPQWVEAGGGLKKN